MKPSTILFPLLSLAGLSAAVELEEISPPSAYLDRRDLSFFDLRSAETFLWGQHVEGDAVLANFTVEMPDDTENILSMERFKGMLKEVECTDTSMKISFVDDGSYRYAQRAWDWVNGADNHSFVMVAGKGECGDNAYRIPYTVHTIQYDDSKLTASLTAQREEWSNIAHTYHLKVGSLPGNQLTRRDVSKSTSMSLNRDYRFKHKVGVGQATVELKCDPCYVAGSIGFEFTLVTDHLIPKDVRFKASPSGVKAEAQLQAIFNVAESPKITKEFTIGSYPLPGGVSIPNVLDFGPVMKLKYVFEVQGQLAVSFGTGATASIPDSALLEANLLNPSNNKVSPWTPSVDLHPIEFDHNQFQANVKLNHGLQFSIQLGITVLKKGVQGELQLKMPYFEHEAELIVSDRAGVCEDAKAKDKNGAIKISHNYGVELKYGFDSESLGGKTVEVTLAAGNFPFPFLPQQCFPFNIPGGPKKSSSAAGATATNKAVDPPSSSSTPGSGANSCKIGGGDGRSGTCINKTTCSSGGKTPVAGWCPNDPDNVQCCVDSPASTPSSGANSCKIGGGDGRSGTCINKTTCGNGGKVAVPGWCPNDPDEVQCCVAKPTSSSAKSCKIGDGDGRSGTCINKSTCSNGGKTPVAGWCPDDPADVQCCVEAASTPPPSSGGKSCKVGDYGSGTCQNKNTCVSSKKVPVPGYCPDDPDDVQCCVESKGNNSCTNDKLNKTGTCMSVTVCENADGVSTAGYCPNDPKGIQCCTSKLSQTPKAGGGKNIPVRF